jgi:type II secretory pathway component PulJ
LSRRGFQLAEIMVAVALAAGPVLLAVHLIHTNVSGARFNVDQATARQALVDLTELLLGETMESLRDVAQPGRADRLNDVLKARIGRLPDAAKVQYEAQLKGILNKFKCELEEDVGGVKGLTRLTLSCQLSRSVIKVARYFRPEARLRPATPAPGSSAPAPAPAN